MKTGIELIADERNEQINKHGITTAKDLVDNPRMQLADAAAVLITPLIITPRKRLSLMPSHWDDVICLKMCAKSHTERLIIAGALIAAEIDRIQAKERKT